jgi:autotransporter-associated beta strand protein
LSTTFAGTIKDDTSSGGTVAITKVGAGTLTLLGQNNYSGPTIVSNGVLALSYNPTNLSDAVLNTSGNVTVEAGAVLDVSGELTNPGAWVFSSGILQGGGTIRGSLSLSGGMVSPGGGPDGNTGTLTVTNSITLGSTAWMKLDRANTPNSDQLVSSLSTVTYGGTLVVTNIGAALQAGDTFTLFGGSGLGAGTFSSIVLPSYYGFDTSRLAVDGSITVTNAFKPAFSSVNFSALSNGSIVLNVTNGAAGGPVNILTSTNLALPLGSWTTNAATTFNGSGNLTSFTITVDPTVPELFIQLQVQ